MKVKKLLWTIKLNDSDTSPDSFFAIKVKRAESAKVALSNDRIWIDFLLSIFNFGSSVKGTPFFNLN